MAGWVSVFDCQRPFPWRPMRRIDSFHFDGVKVNFLQGYTSFISCSIWQRKNGSLHIWLSHTRASPSSCCANRGQASIIGERLEIPASGGMFWNGIPLRQRLNSTQWNRSEHAYECDSRLVANEFNHSAATWPPNPNNEQKKWLFFFAMRNILNRMESILEHIIAIWRKTTYRSPHTALPWN